MLRLLGQHPVENMAHDRLHSVQLQDSLVYMHLDYLCILLDQASLAEVNGPVVYRQLIKELVWLILIYLKLLDVLLVIEVLRQWLAYRLDLLHFHELVR